jgi:hypothetical protein
MPHKRPRAKNPRRAKTYKGRIPLGVRAELCECLRQGITIDYACAIARVFKAELFEAVSKDVKLATELTEAVEAGKRANIMQTWLTLLEVGHRPSQAARMVGSSMQLMNERKLIDPSFAAQAIVAETSGTDYLEDAARARGLAGSDILLMFTLKARAPERFRDSQPSVQINNNALILKPENQNYERGRRIAFALQLAASGQAAGDRDRHGGDTGGPDVGADGGTADTRVSQPRR